MIVYEVNLHVDAIAADEYSEWLGPHIEQILDIEGFQKAEWLVCDSDDDKVHWSIRYHLDSRKSLVNYHKITKPFYYLRLSKNSLNNPCCIKRHNIFIFLTNSYESYWLINR